MVFTILLVQLNYATKSTVCKYFSSIVHGLSLFSLVVMVARLVHSSGVGSFSAALGHALFSIPCRHGGRPAQFMA